MEGVARVVAVVVGMGACAGCVELPFVHHAAVAPPSVRQAAGPTEQANDLDQLPSKALLTPRDAVVRLVGPDETCSGTLIKEDVVLTSHHCVVERGPHGEFTSKLMQPGQLQIQLGGDYLPIANVGVKAVLAPPCGEAGGSGDVALLVLERKLVGMWKWPVDDDAPRAGDFVRPLGFGRCALSPEGVRRREDRLGGEVTSIDGGTFEAQASVCPGDSGGPVIDPRTCDRNGVCEVIGVVSLSAMDHDDSTRGRTIFARIPAMVKDYAEEVSKGTDPSDLPPLSCEP